MKMRSGVAMLLVMMTCTLLIVGVVIVARARASTFLTQQQGVWQTDAGQLLSASEVPILSWLEEESKTVVFIPEAKSPFVEVLDDRFQIKQVPVEIQIIAWDQQGMWPRNAVELGFQPPFQLNAEFGTPPNLAQLPLNAHIYPTTEQPEAIGARIATHNPWPNSSGQTRSRGGVTINVNTAPMVLLEQIMDRFDVSDLDQLRQQRSEGKMARLPQTNRDANGREVRLVGVSRVWSFRVQVSVGQLTRGMWVVYINQGGQWKLAQRTMINEPID